MFVGIGLATVELFFVFVLLGVRRGVAVAPEDLNEALPLGIRGELAKGRFLFRRNDGAYIVKPFLGPAAVLGVAAVLGSSRTLQRILVGRSALCSVRALGLTHTSRCKATQSQDQMTSIGRHHDVTSPEAA